MNNMEKKIEVKNLRISFRTDAGKVQAVRGIDFDLYKGETLAIVGESGSGKSVTNKAIVGISAGNAIIESGEIIYDGQDLLQISEEEFHKLRGDKIAMIFQDPLSALDPINRIGMQMTEAMILKNRANRKNARRDFNKKMKNLVLYMNKAMEAEGGSEVGKRNEANAKKFDDFEKQHLKLEGFYNVARDAANDCLEAVKDLAFFIEKDAVSDFDNLSKTIVVEGKKTVHEYVCSEEILAAIDEFSLGLKGIKSQKGLFGAKKVKIDYSALVAPLQKMETLLEEGLAKEAPNYFALAYYLSYANEPLPEMETGELNVFLRKYLDDNFMLAFIEDAKQGVIYSFNRTNEAKEKVIETVTEKRELFVEDKLDKKQARKVVKELSALVMDAIDQLAVKKDSTTYTFPSALSKAVETYYMAGPNNAKELKKFNREQAKYDKIVAKGKTPDYKVTPAKLIDEAMAKENILHRLDLIVETYQKNLKEVDQFNADQATVDLIDFFKEQAQRVAHVVTKALAKTKALKLMKEVGIPNPRQRYRQFPFEFSGGMRQRIVIAIALSADPDVLICDEPTTALDVTIQSQILELINRIKKQRNLSIIFITHDLGVVANMADRIAVMYAGKIVEMGTSEDIFYDPRHPYTWALLSSMPDLDTKEKLDAIPGTPPNMIYPPKGDAFAQRNKYAMEIDFELEPPMFEISPTHKAATWLLHEQAPKITPPQAILDRIERMKAKGKGGRAE